MSEMLKNDDRVAFDAKFNVFRSIENLPGDTTLFTTRRMETLGLLSADYEDFAIGTFENLDSIRLKWIAPDRFTFIPRAGRPFAFVRYNGERIEPRRMFTDGGSIPRLLTVSEEFSPWGYAPAYLIHDWEFDLKHCNRFQKSFEAVRDTMMEGIKTLMETGIVDRATLSFKLIHGGINSGIARRIWNRQHPQCPIPADYAE